MLNFLGLTAFMRHKDLCVDFSEGLNVIWGRNEVGKSSLLTGLAYNWFGAAMLPKPINDIVHRGCKKTQLMTVTRFGQAGAEYECRRGWSGAELLDGTGEILATGQKEVTQMIEGIFGIPPGKAADIIFAVQGGIRGVLAMGPTAAIELIEKLGDFGQIDEIIRKFTTTEPTGPIKHLETQLEGLVLTEEAMDTAPFEEREKKAAGLLGKAEAAHGKTREVLDRLEAQGQRAAAMVKTLRQSQAILEGQRQAVTTRSAELAGLISEEPALKQQHLDETRLLADYSLWNTYKDVTRLPSIGLEWDGVEESLLAEIARAEAQVNEFTGRAAGIERSIGAAELKAAEGRLACGECGRPYDNAAEVRQAQARAQALASDLRKELDLVGASIHDAKDELSSLQLIWRTHDETKEFIGSLEGIEECRVTAAAIPWAVEWTAQPPKEVSHESAGEANPTLVKQKIDAIPSYKRELDGLKGTAPSAEEVAEIEKQIEAVSPADPEAISTARAREALADRTEQAARAELTAAVSALASAKTEIAVAEARRKEQKIARGEIKKQISATAENNSVLKALREARGKVSGLLWDNVLTATSVYFSQFRGQQSQVARSPKGFVINKETFPLSGSTLDVLGLALRVSIAKVFANCPTLVLDEPSAGCDEDRTAAMTAGLKTVGFGQVILVTHRRADEFVADNLIELV